MGIGRSNREQIHEEELIKRIKKEQQERNARKGYTKVFSTSKKKK
jgi:hypothetical protein